MAEKRKTVSKEVRTLPYSVEAEQSLLGCILLSSDMAIEILSNLDENDFYSTQHKIVVEAMKKVLKDHKPVDFITVADELNRVGQMAQIGGIGYLSTINSAVPSSANWKYYFDITKKHSTMRKLIQTCSQITEDAFSAEDAEKMLASAESQIYGLSSQTAPGDLMPLYDSIASVLGRFEKIQKDPNSLMGIPSGIRSLDKETNGFHGGEIIIIAGRPGMGKTSLAMNMIENAALNKKFSCAIFSLEMSAESLAQRSICSVAGVPMRDALSGKLTPQQWQSLWNASQGFSQAKIFVNRNANINVDQMLSKCRRLKAKEGLDMVLLDYIQLTKSAENKKDSNRQQEVADISRSLKLMAMELDVPILVLSQLRRSGGNEESKRPQLSDLRESGAIEQDADIVLMLYKPDGEDEPTASSKRVAIYVAKHRQGRNDFDINMDWVGEIFRFREVDSFSMAITKQFQENKQAKKDREVQQNQEESLDDMQTVNMSNMDMSNISDIPMPDEAPPEYDEAIFENIEG